MCEGRRSKRANICRDTVYLAHLRKSIFISRIRLISGATGGYTPGSTNSMEYITITSSGNGLDFGDLVAATANGFDTVSTAHGGL